MSDSQPPSSTPVLPTEVFYLIAELVVASKDAEDIKACSLTFRPWTRYFQRALCSLEVHCLSFLIADSTNPEDTWEAKRSSTLLELLKEDPSFGESIPRIEVDIWDPHILTGYPEDLLGMGTIAASCTKLESFDYYDVSWPFQSRHDAPCPTWPSISQHLRGTLERIAQSSTLKRIKIQNANIDWSSLIPNSRLQRVELGCVELLEHDAAWVDPEGSDAFFDDADAVCGPTVIVHLVADSSSLEGLASAVHPTCPPDMLSTSPSSWSWRHCCARIPWILSGGIGVCGQPREVDSPWKL